MDIKEKLFNQILDFKDQFVTIKTDNIKDNIKINVKVLLSSDLYEYFKLKFSEFYRMDLPFTISGFPEYEGESGIFFPEQGFLQLYEQIEEESMSMFTEVYYDKKLIVTYSNKYYE
jgi:hypothetical protein